MDPATCKTAVLGGTCGAIALGRCRYCLGAFCDSHQGAAESSSVSDLCASCFSLYVIGAPSDQEPTGLDVVRRAQARERNDWRSSVDSLAKRIASSDPSKLLVLEYPILYPPKQEKRKWRRRRRYPKPEQTVRAIHVGTLEGEKRSYKGSETRGPSYPLRISPDGQVISPASLNDNDGPQAVRLMHLFLARLDSERIRDSSV